MLKRLYHSAHGLLSPESWRIRIIFWAGAVIVGLIASFFAQAADYSNALFQRLIAISPYLPLVVTPALIMLAAWLTKRVFPGAEGSGIPQCIAALDIHEESVRAKLLSWRIAFGKIVLTLLGLLSGASIGREGPTVHIGAAVLFSLGRLGRFPFHYMDRGMILAGGAAGIAAAFNTPLAGILFAIEEMSRSFEERTSGTLITAVILAGITSIALLGNYTYLGIVPANVSVSTGLLPVLVCGVAGGLLGGLFSTLLLRGQKLIKPLYRRRTLLVAGTCGLIIAVIGLISGGATYGSGYEAARALVQDTHGVNDSFPYLKLLATAVSYWSGIPGGIFAPSLATGAGLGAHLAQLFPHTDLAAVVLLGTVAYFAGVVQTPITAFVIVMEMTHNNDLLIPLMATAFIAYGASRLVCPRPIYQALAEDFLNAAPKPTAEAPPTEQRPNVP
jgi:H+/Cl- antiporter ClcA